MKKIGKKHRAKYEAIGGGKARCLRCSWVGSANAFARFRHDANAHDGPTKSPPKPKVEPKPPPTGKAAAKLLVDTTRKLDNLTRYGEPTAIQKPIVASLERKKERLQEALGGEDVTMLLAPRPSRDYAPVCHIRFAPPRTYPIGQLPPQLDTGGIPEFLIRKASK